MLNAWLETNKPIISNIKRVLTEAEFLPEYSRLPLRTIQRTLDGCTTEIQRLQGDLNRAKTRIKQLEEELNNANDYIEQLKRENEVLRTSKALDGSWNWQQ